MSGTGHDRELRKSLLQSVPCLCVGNQDQGFGRVSMLGGGVGIFVCRIRVGKMRMDDGDSMDSMAVGKKGDIGKIAHKQDQEKNSYADVFFYFLHVAFTKEKAKVINDFELF